MTREPTASFEVFAFRYRDARISKWVKARYHATPEEIAARYAKWEITGPGEERRPRTSHFNPGRRGRGSGEPGRAHQPAPKRVLIDGEASAPAGAILGANAD